MSARDETLRALGTFASVSVVEELIPPPDFHGFPVVEAVDGLEKRLNAGASREDYGDGVVLTREGDARAGRAQSR